MNDRIRVSPLLIIDGEGKKLGEFSRDEALKLAAEQEIDLILVAPDARPPVAKLLDYGKYLYEQKKADKKQKSSGKALEAKGIRLGLRIAEHDLEVRRKQAEGFLQKGHKIKVELRFRGREIIHSDLGLIKAKDFATRLDEVSKVELQPKMIGRNIIMILAPKK
jgi:translation initiation factor IF-3